MPNPHCECAAAGWCKRHKMEKDDRQFKRCQGVLHDATCGHAHWIAWEQGGLGATAPEDPKLDVEWECRGEQIEKRPPRTTKKLPKSPDGCKVGTRVKQILAAKGIRTNASCACNRRAVEMDSLGCQGCREKMDECIKMLMEGASERVWLKPLVSLFGGTAEKWARQIVEQAIADEQDRIDNPPPEPVSWAYGVTTVISRLSTTLPETLQSLEAGGFDKPRLFIDGAEHTVPELGKYEQSVRTPLIKTFGNFILGLWELYVRNPHVTRYAIFQDDVLVYKNLRQYLEKCQMPAKGYWNLYTWPQNKKISKGPGWQESNQRGLGALGLVFSRPAVHDLLSSYDHIISRPMILGDRSWKAVDGGVVSALNKKGWKEYFHDPSLVQHIGRISSMYGGKERKSYPQADTFKGEDFDALELLDVQ